MSHHGRGRHAPMIAADDPFAEEEDWDANAVCAQEDGDGGGAKAGAGAKKKGWGGSKEKNTVLISKMLDLDRPMITPQMIDFLLQEGVCEVFAGFIVRPPGCLGDGAAGGAVGADGEAKEGRGDGGGDDGGDESAGAAVTASALDALLRAGVEFAPCVDYAQAKKGYQYREGTQGLGYYLQPQGAGGTSTQSAKAADGGDGGGGSSSDSSDRGGAGAAGAAAAAAGGGGSSPASLLCDTTERDQSDMVALKRSYQAAQLLANQQNNDTLLTFLAKKTGVIATTMFAGFEGDSGGNMFHICMVLDKLLKQHTDALLTTLCESTERIEQSFAVMMRHLHHAPVGKLIADLACTPASSMMSDE